MENKAEILRKLVKMGQKRGKVDQKHEKGCSKTSKIWKNVENCLKIDLLAPMAHSSGRAKGAIASLPSLRANKLKVLLQLHGI